MPASSSSDGPASLIDLPQPSAIALNTRPKYPPERIYLPTDTHVDSWKQPLTSENSDGSFDGTCRTHHIVITWEPRSRMAHPITHIYNRRTIEFSPTAAQTASNSPGA